MTDRAGVGREQISHAPGLLPQLVKLSAETSPMS
jgi:hypothetical protein